jgi:hypothetical protein
MVALTGIELVKRQATLVQVSLSGVVSVPSVPPRLQKSLFETLWCDRGVTPRVFSCTSAGSEVW